MSLTDSCCRLKARFYVLILAAAFISAAEPALAQQCKTCAGATKLPPGQVVASLTSASDSTYSTILTNVGSGYNISDGAYPGWTVGPYAPVPSSPHRPKLYSTYNTSLPYDAQGLPWDKVNWLLNHKHGTASDVQAVLWSLLAGAPDPGLTADGTALYANADNNGAGYVPDPGDSLAVLVYGDGVSSSVYTILEATVPDCGRIGDFVWNDLNYNGIQEPGEPGINNVTLTLQRISEGGGLRTVGTTVTTTKDGQLGYYQFKGLCPGTYFVTVDPASPPLLFMTPSPVGVGGASADSNQSPAYTLIDSVNGSDQTVDFGYFIPAQVSTNLELTKTPSSPTVSPLSPVTYTYVAKNKGTVMLNGLTINDDNGTPDFAGDDFVAGSAGTLAPGASVTFTAVRTPPMPHCAIVNNQIMGVGTLVPEYVGAGDVKVTFRQNRYYVDNTYGSTASKGWLSGHTFSNFTGSDKAEFRFADKTGRVVLDFYLDYISASTLYPSGYGTLGPFGGDGGWISGTQSNVLSYSTTMTTNLNQSPAFYGYTVNSPPEPNSKWDYIDGYTVTVSKAAFGTAGFGSVVIPYIHNSPSMTGKGAISPVPCQDSTVTNVATAVAYAANDPTTPIKATASASVVILAPGPSLTTSTKKNTKLPPPPPPNTCTADSFVKSDFNGTKIKAGNYIWFNAVMDPGAVPAAGVTIKVTDGTIQYKYNGKVYTIEVPDAVIDYRPSADGAKTIFNNDAGRWETTVPIKYDKNVFMAGAGYQVPFDLSGVKDVVWTATVTTNAKIDMSWKWAAAVYTAFPMKGADIDLDALGVKSVDDKTDAVYKNADHAGTPEDFTDYVIGGARGGGGSNYTGSYSGTVKPKFGCQ